MHTNLHSLYSVQQIREIETRATRKYKITAKTMMQRAGRAALRSLQENWPHAKKIGVMCGKGNNGGDGFVLASLAKRAGYRVTVFYISPPETLTDEAKNAAKVCQKMKVKFEKFAPEKISGFDVYVDALLGIGIKGAVSDEYKRAIVAINDSQSPILAIDVPSGLDADTGNVCGVAVSADLTITFIGLKRGLFISQAGNFCGKIKCDDLNLPAEIFSEITPAAEILDLNSLQDALPKRARAATKNDFGHVLVIGGDSGYAGAARMAGEAAARTGGGLISVATRPEHIAIISGSRPELMCHGIKTSADLEKLIIRATVIAIGPGLGRTNWGEELWQYVLKANKPLVIDADALNLLANAAKQYKRNDWILTPHLGEAARLLHCDIATVEKDRWQAVRKLQQTYGGIVVLKGAGTLICDREGRIYVCILGNPGMASGGMGDILSGVIAGLLAQGLNLDMSAKLGVMLHAAAGDLAAGDSGERGLLALDLLPYLRCLINCKSEKKSKVLKQ